MSSSMTLMRHVLAQLRADLHSKLRDGTDCPVCGQHAKVYRRKINATMAKTLITMFNHAWDDWVHVPSLPGDTHEASQLVWWGLIEEEQVLRPDGGRAGYWRVTWAGECFVMGKTAVPKYAEIYDGKVIGMDATSTVTIREALGTKFDYSDLMAGR